MTKNKIFTIIVLCVIMTICITLATQGTEAAKKEGDFNLLQVKMNDNLKNEISSEIAKNLGSISEAVYGYSYRTIDENGDAIINDKPPTQSVKVDYEKTFMIYGIKSEDLIADYNKKQNFGKLISQDYSLNMPVLASDNSIISAVEMRKIKGPERLLFVEANDQKAKNEMKKYASENGGVENFVLVEDADKQTKDDMLKYATKNKDKYKISIIGQYLPLEAIEIFSDETKLSNLLDSTGISDIQNVKLVSLYDYGMEIVYFTKGNQEEYAIPFKYNPNFYKSMQNGKTYTIQELIDMISQEF